MSRVIAYKCKTPGCDAILQVAEVLPDDTNRSIHIMLRVGDPVLITDPDCKQEHEYTPEDKQMVQAV
jgi:hypothetical protein